jgi:multidrug efflux pump subunit AcrB
LIGSTITPVVVFLPLVSVSGVTGSFFRALAITMTAALLTSLVLALTWTPGLSLVLLSERRNDAAQHDNHAGRLMAGVIKVHRRLLDWALAKPLWLGAVCLAAGGGDLGGLSGPGLRPAAGDGRGRFHSRLHHARRQFAD